MAVDPRAVLAELGVDDAIDVSPVKGGADTLLWRVTTPSRTYALRLMRAEQAAVWLREVAAMRAARAGGLTVPAIERDGTWQGRPMMLMEWCAGRTMLAEIQSRPWRSWGLARSLGRTQARLNQIAAPPELTERVDAWIHRARPDPALRERLVAVARSTDRLLHLDFHPLNVMTDGREITAVLDWTNSHAGDPRADIARTLAILRISPMPPELPRVLTTLMTRLIAAGWWSGYRAASGDPGDMAPFHAWAGAEMVRDWEPRLSQPGHWLRDHHLEPARRWTATWRRRAGI